MIMFYEAQQEMKVGDTFVADHSDNCHYELTLAEGGGFRNKNDSYIRLNTIYFELCGEIVKPGPKVLTREQWEKTEPGVFITPVSTEPYDINAMNEKIRKITFKFAHSNGRLERDTEIQPAIKALQSAREVALREGDSTNWIEFLNMLERALDNIPPLVAAIVPAMPEASEYCQKYDYKPASYERGIILDNFDRIQSERDVLYADLMAALKEGASNNDVTDYAEIGDRVRAAYNKIINVTSPAIHGIHCKCCNADITEKLHLTVGQDSFCDNGCISIHLKFTSQAANA